jgi:exoribonuclease II
MIINPRRGKILRLKGYYVSSVALRPGSLVLYKIHPAIVVSVAEKIEITLDGGRSKRVRDKDVTVLHPGPVSSLAALDAGAPAIEEAWELLEDERVSLADFAELLFGEFTPAAAWGAWQVLQDGLYFEGGAGTVRRRSADKIASEREARDEKVRAQQAWDAFTGRVADAALCDDDRSRLAEVERVALGAVAQSRILKHFGQPETPEAAHRFLLRCGYWPADHNPWPIRAGAELGPLDIGVPGLADEPRRDLTGLEAWAIDDAGNADPDDAISLDGDRLWVHVADVAALVAPGGHLDQAARRRGANLYLPEQVHGMLPDTVTTRLGLGLDAVSPALSFGFGFDGENLTDIEITPSWVKVHRASYDDVDARMDEQPFAAIRAITDRYRARRVARDAARIDLPEVAVRLVDDAIVIRPLPKLDSRDMVTDAMLMAGEAAARFAVANLVPIPFATQPAPDAVRYPVLLSEMYAYRRLFKPSRVSLDPEAHFGLGLELYARATSPLRRYADLLVHQQLRAFVTGATMASREQLAERLVALDGAGAVIRRAERLSNLHWKLVYLARTPGWRGEGIVVALEERKAFIMIPSLGMETRVRRNDALQLDQSLTLTLQQVDLPLQEAQFHIA